MKIMFNALSLIVAFAILCSPIYAADEVLTKGKLAEMVISNTNLFTEDEIKSADKNELIKMAFKKLSSLGLDFFKEADPNSPVNYEDFIKTLVFISTGNANNIDAQLELLYKNGLLPPDFMIVENVRKGIKNYYENYKKWPDKLDDAMDGIASPDNPFFTKVLPEGISDNWQKNEYYYTSPSTGITYIYEPQTGRFYPVSNVDLDFATQILGNVEAYSPEKPKGEPEDDKELVDS